MAGGTAAYAAIQVNLIIALGLALRGKPCRPYGSELKIAVADHIRYREAFVACPSIPPRATVVSDPVVVFEVLNEGSDNADLLVKNADYRATPSIKRSVVLQQTHAACIVFARQGDDWVTELLHGPSALLWMPEIEVEIPLADLYAGVDLEDGPGE